VLDGLLTELDAGRYDALICVRLDRLARSVGGFAGMMDRAKRHGWRIIMLDPAVDMTTPYGEAMAGMAAVFAQLERSLISQRTIEGLAVARAEGRVLGMPTYTNREVIERMARMRGRSMSYHEIASQLNAENVPTVRNGRWYGRTVQRVLNRREGNTR
jgi:DNA invertase Pin-like site-specific DNA recombinase